MKIYKCPIDMFALNGVSFDELARKAAEAFDDEVIASVRKVGINVDKGELLKALEYDRGQYEKGYADAKAQYERKRGYWIVHEERTEVNDGFIDFFPTEYECSNCGLKQSMYFIDSKPSNFCPNCGADMRGKDGEDD